MTGVTRLFKQVQVDRFYPVMLSPLNTQDEMNEVLTALIYKCSPSNAEETRSNIKINSYAVIDLKNIHEKYFLQW